MPGKPNRTEILKLRVTPEEKALIVSGARAAGLTPSEYVRREAGIGKFGRADLRRGRRPRKRRRVHGEAGKVIPELFEDRVARYEEMGMTRPAATLKVRQEIARAG